MPEKSGADDVNAAEEIRNGASTLSDNERAERYERALRELADPENWHGNPESQDAWLFGRYTPYELAVEALAGRDIY